MQSHAGLAQYRDRGAVIYSNGENFRSTKSSLFTVMGELEDWVTTLKAGGAAASDSVSANVGSRPQTLAVQNAHNAMRSSTQRWQRTAEVNGDGWARVRRHPNRKYRAEPTYFVPVHLAKGTTPRERPFPLLHQAPVTKPPRLPPPLPQYLHEGVAVTLSRWEDCVAYSARADLEKAVTLADRDEEILGEEKSPEGHRQRARCGAENAEIRIGPDMYHPTVNELLRHGYTIDLTEGKPKVRVLSPAPAGAWGINADRLCMDARAINWPDQELLFFLKYGFTDYSGGTPPISSFSPHQQKAIRNAKEFKARVQEEIKMGWIGPPLRHPPSLPFQVRPGSLEPKSDGSFRLVWNASWPSPDSLRSAALIGKEWFPIAPNASTILPSALEFEWCAIESNNEILAIMADGAIASGAPLLSRTFDFTKCFRQLPMASSDLWKCAVHADGAFREDRRMQMGRRSSAHSGQRTTFLLTALLQSATCAEGWGLRSPGAQGSATQDVEQHRFRAWLAEREQLFKRDGSPNASQEYATGGLVRFSSFQDDITAFAIGRAAAQDATEGVFRILEGTYGVPLSTKEKAAKDFDSVFTSIGASYNLVDPGNIRCSPREEKIEKYRSSLASLKTSYPLTTLRELQRFVGLHTFVSRFLPEGEYYCNSAYCCLRASTHTAAQLRPISRNLLKDAAAVLALLKGQRLAPLTADPVFAHPGLQGFSTNASCATDAKATGYGIHLMGLLSSGSWSAGIKAALAQNKLSISPLELLAAAFALEVAGRHRPWLLTGRQLVLRNDSESACTVVYSMRADSAPMLEALGILNEFQQASGLRVKLQHITTTENRIADSMSRGSRQAAVREASRNYNAACVQPPAKAPEWEERVLRAALQAARHSDK